MPPRSRGSPSSCSGGSCHDAPSIPLFISPQWGVYNTTRLTGFPSRFRPYASAIPGGSPTGGYPAPDALPVLLEVRPR